MKFPIIFFILLAYALNASAQTNGDTIFYNSKWVETKNQDSARFFRLQQKEGSGYRVRDYYINGTLQMSGFFLSFDPEVKEDSFKYYYENGILSSDGLYKNNKKTGIWNWYFPSGKVSSTLRYENGKVVSANSKAPSTNIYARTGVEIVFEHVEVMPVFPGGNEGLKQYIVDNIVYPLEARKKEIQGRVIVRFVIDSDGKVKDAAVVSKVHPLLDESALEMVRSMPVWAPGKQDGKPVNVYFTLPVRFSL